MHTVMQERVVEPIGGNSGKETPSIVVRMTMHPYPHFWAEGTLSLSTLLPSLGGCLPWPARKTA